MTTHNNILTILLCRAIDTGYTGTIADNGDYCWDIRRGSDVPEAGYNGWNGDTEYQWADEENYLGDIASVKRLRTLEEWIDIWESLPNPDDVDWEINDAAWRDDDFVPEGWSENPEEWD